MRLKTAHSLFKRLKGKGKDLGNGTKGDLILTYHVSLPTDLSDKQKELLKQMRDA